MERVKAADPNNLQISSDLGLLYHSAGEFEKAKLEFAKVLASSPKSSVAHYGLGLALKDLGKKEEAIQAFRKAREHSPKFADPYLEAGDLLRELGKVEEAKKEYEAVLPVYRELLNQEKKNQALRLRYAEALSKAGRADEAKKFLPEEKE
jgi:tetratricopeptide (TPR) repeat protein